MIITIYIQKFEKLSYILVFLILPLMLLLFFIGLDIFEGIFQISFSAFIGLLISYFNYYLSQMGVITIFFPLGLAMTIHNFTYKYRNNKKKVASWKENNKYATENSSFKNKYYYLLLFMLPYSFMISAPFYAKVLYFPIIIIFSIKGLVFIQKKLLKYWRGKAILIPIFLSLTISFLVSLYWGLLLKITYWNLVPFILTSVFLVIFIYLLKNSHKIKKIRLSINFSKLKNHIWIIGLTISILVFSSAILEANRAERKNNPYPWENRYLTEEEIEITNFFQSNNLEGLISVFDPYIAERLAGFGFLPAISKPTVIGIPLYYNIISPKSVYRETIFTFASFERLNLFNYTKIDPITELRISISNLDLGEKVEFYTFLSYNIQYIITTNQTSYPIGINDWSLLLSLQNSNLVFSNDPVFKTKNFQIWRIY
jgi:hypothetical protein